MAAIRGAQCAREAAYQDEERLVELAAVVRIC